MANIITPEIPGVGEYNQLVSPRNFDEMISFMREKHLAQLEGNTNVALAMSLGGMLIKRWSELYPQDFSKIVLLNTSFKGINPVTSRLRPASMLSFLRVFAQRETREKEKIILEMVANNQSKREERLSDWVAIQKDAPVSKKSALNQIIAALTFDPGKEKPKAELLFLACKGDRLCSYTCSEKLSKTWDAPLELHENGGHDLPIDDPQWLLERLENFYSLSHS